ncbi:hypothetical protein FNV43_RR24616 [Rhamnella rubrinervis]|uniref:Uncharacterized protein n=1 Tax=Rhamnella rubrinervis TaxID=2594499 RepID=A0A8K0DSL2_9ROSA|nr:hypothetical protein FNV43_RR24616 [Rhamnella rubrinervis]
MDLLLRDNIQTRPQTTPSPHHQYGVELLQHCSRATYVEWMALPLRVDHPIKEVRSSYKHAHFLHFFYMKPSEEGKYAFYAHRPIRLLEDAPTSDKGWKERYFIKREGLFDIIGTSDSGIRSAWSHSTQWGIGHPSKELMKLTPNTLKPNQSSKGGIALVQQKDLTVAIPVEKSPPPKRQRRSSPPEPSKEIGKAPQMPKTCLRLEDIASIRSKLDQVMEIMDGLMTRHNRVILKGMKFEDISHEAEQCALKADNAWKKKATALNNLAATNKKLDEEVQRLQQIAADTIRKTEQLEKNWSEADLKLTEKEEKLRNLRLDFLRFASERNELQAQVVV